MSRSATAALAAVGLAAGTLTLTPGAAQAAVYGGQCGAGYSLGSQRAIPGGTVFLAKKGDAGCAITIRTSTGAALPMSVWIRATGNTTWINNPGDFTSYAGPVYSSDYLGCLDYGGQINGAGGTWYNVCW